MKLEDLKADFNQILKGHFDTVQEVESVFWIISENLFSIDRLKYAVQRDIEVESGSLSIYDQYVKRLLKHEPIQYILGKTYFYGLELKVDPSVLIPRPETEELVDWVLNDCKDSKIDALDICTGSGCIAIILQKYKKKSDIYAIDISQEALNLAKINSALVEKKIHFHRADALKLDEDNFFNQKKWDVIVSNPPYVLESEKSLMKNNVLKYEPHLALFVEDSDPLLFYRQIMKYAYSNLRENGQLFLEYNRAKTDDMAELCRSIGFVNFEFRNDFRSNPRMMKIWK